MSTVTENPPPETAVADAPGESLTQRAYRKLRDVIVRTGRGKQVSDEEVTEAIVLGGISARVFDEKTDMLRKRDGAIKDIESADDLAPEIITAGDASKSIQDSRDETRKEFEKRDAALAADCHAKQQHHSALIKEQARLRSSGRKLLNDTASNSLKKGLGELIALANSLRFQQQQTAKHASAMASRLSSDNAQRARERQGFGGRLGRESQADERVRVETEGAVKTAEQNLERLNNAISEVESEIESIRAAMLLPENFELAS